MQVQARPATGPLALSAKPHYAILDGLRGVAALFVVAFHLCEAHTANHLEQLLNHGYLAVDFFFLLSGFVVGYAYDDRWGRGLTVGQFFKIRLVRLQPMVVVGTLIGALLFYSQDSALFPGISEVPVWKLLLLTGIGMTLLPVPISMDIRGWQEMHPLDGPGWSLFFEYVANILYALGVRKFSKAALTGLVVLSGAALLHLLVTSPKGDITGGWSLEAEQLRIGFTRLLYPFFAGLLLSRVATLGHVKHAFGWCSLLLLLVLGLPRVGGASHLWLNGLYEALAIIFVFPLVVWLGASGHFASASSARVGKLLGDISYPLYITHYALIYSYTAWVNEHKLPLSQTWPVAVLTFVAAVVVAYACLKGYDEPVRAWLKKRFLVRS